MTHTMADMTPEEQADCVGMWAHDGFELGVIGRVYPSGMTQLIFPGTYQTGGRIPQEVTPRPDLPRAWTPNGEPVPGEWADGHMWWGEDADTMQTVDLVGAECLATGQVQGFEEWPEGVTPGEDVPVRRYVTDWEEA